MDIWIKRIMIICAQPNQVHQPDTQFDHEYCTCGVTLKPPVHSKSTYTELVPTTSEIRSSPKTPTNNVSETKFVSQVRQWGFREWVLINLDTLFSNFFPRDSDCLTWTNRNYWSNGSITILPIMMLKTRYQLLAVLSGIFFKAGMCNLNLLKYISPHWLMQKNFSRISYLFKTNTVHLGTLMELY